MRWLLPLALLLFFAHPARATTYYICGSTSAPCNGSDSNNGTSKTTAWLHAPGMSGATGTPASYSCTAGDQFIFRGGDTWHYGNSGAVPYVGATQWTWTCSGSSTSVRTTISVDKTWFTGGSWVKPIFSGDNAITNSFPASCTYDEGSNLNFQLNINASHVFVSNLEMSGKCWSNTTSGGSQIWGYIFLGTSDTDVIMDNLYLHGWSTTPTSADYHYNVYGGSGATADGNTFQNGVISGQDSSRVLTTGSQSATYCLYGAQIGLTTNNLCASGQGIYGKCFDLHNSYLGYMGNFMVSYNVSTMHDNIFEYLYFTYSGVSNQQHPNVDNQISQVTGQSESFYNNIIRHIYTTESIYFAVTTNIYVFNNVWYDNMNVPDFGIISTGCYRFNKVSNSLTSVSASIYDNTYGDQNCLANFDNANAPLTAWNGSATFENQHFVGTDTTLSQTYTCVTPSTCTINNNGGNVFQTTANATTQGYVAGNNYAPTTGSGATIGAGNNATANCSTFSSDMALCSGTSGAITVSSGTVTYPAISINPRPSSGSWNAGAYFYTASVSSVGSALSSGTGLKGATIQ